MFGEAEKLRLPVALALTTGERLQGDLLLTRVQKLHEVLNRPEQFVELAARDGRIIVVGKSSIASASGVELPSLDQLAKRPSTDPHRILGVESSADRSAIRSAYHAKARLYHPDQFANLTLPTEVAEYMNAMFIHVQAAYDELSSHLEHADAPEGTA